MGRNSYKTKTLFDGGQMKKLFVAVAALLLASISAYAQDASNPHAYHLMEANTFNPPGQDWAKARVDKSPRHQEWVKVKQGSRNVNSFVVYPEVKNKATA